MTKLWRAALQAGYVARRARHKRKPSAPGSNITGNFKMVTAER